MIKIIIYYKTFTEKRIHFRIHATPFFSLLSESVWVLWGFCRGSVGVLWGFSRGSVGVLWGFSRGSIEFYRGCN